MKKPAFHHLSTSRDPGCHPLTGAPPGSHQGTTTQPHPAPGPQDLLQGVGHGVGFDAFHGDGTTRLERHTTQGAGLGTDHSGA